MLFNLITLFLSKERKHKFITTVVQEKIFCASKSLFQKCMRRIIFYIHSMTVVMKLCFFSFDCFTNCVALNSVLFQIDVKENQCTNGTILLFHFNSPPKSFSFGNCGYTSSKVNFTVYTILKSFSRRPASFRILINFIQKQNHSTITAGASKTNFWLAEL